MALRDQPYLPLYVQDFLTDEKLANCTAESTGVYIRLLCIMHKSETYGKILLRQKFQQSERQVSNFAYMLARQMPYEMTVIERSLDELLEENVLYIDGNALCQKRMIKDGDISEKRANAGRKGAEKANNRSVKKRGFADIFASAKLSANSENEIESDNASENETMKERFDSFWKAYPKKVGKIAARKAFDKAGVNADTLIAAVEKQKKWEQWTRDGGRYIPNPATWLNQGRWEDAEFDAGTTDRRRAKGAGEYTGPDFFDDD